MKKTILIRFAAALLARAPAFAQGKMDQDKVNQGKMMDHGKTDSKAKPMKKNKKLTKSNDKMDEKMSKDKTPKDKME